MSRRTSRKVSNIVSYNENDDIESAATEVPIKPLKSPKKVRKGVVEEQVSINDLRTNTTSSNTGKHLSVEETETVVKIKKSPGKPKVKAEPVESVAIKEVDVNGRSPVKSGKNKRKIKAEEGVNEETEDKKSTKKRKTKEEKGAEAMPLAARTAIQALKRPMYIGAHISAAGGKLLRPNSRFQLTYSKVSKTQSTMPFTLAETHSPSFSNPNENGRVLQWPQKPATNSTLSALSTNMTPRSMSSPTALTL